MATGEVEVLVHQLDILNPSETPPFQIDESGGAQAGEDLRLQYRYLDLRRPPMARNLVLLRHRVAKAVRDYFDGNGFLEVETPILFKSTPEGAREYLVCRRGEPGQILRAPAIAAAVQADAHGRGVDRYFQIAKCFRDEDLRADRQPGIHADRSGDELHHTRGHVCDDRGVCSRPCGWRREGRRFPRHFRA